MSISYIIIIVYGNINMIAKYMPNLKKMSEIEDKSTFKPVIVIYLWDYVFGHFKRCGIE